MRLDTVGVIGEPGEDLAGAVRGVPVHEVHELVVSAIAEIPPTVRRKAGDLPSGSR